MKNEGIHHPKSSWPLFRHLTFLDGHIRPRKSYKSMMKRNVKDDHDYIPPGRTPMVEIKFERDEHEVSDLYNCEYET